MSGRDYEVLVNIKHCTLLLAVLFMFLDLFQIDIEQKDIGGTSHFRISTGNFRCNL